MVIHKLICLLSKLLFRSISKDLYFTHVNQQDYIYKCIVTDPNTEDRIFDSYIFLMAEVFTKYYQILDNTRMCFIKQLTSQQRAPHQHIIGLITTRQTKFQRQRTKRVLSCLKRIKNAIFQRKEREQAKGKQKQQAIKRKVAEKKVEQQPIETIGLKQRVKSFFTRIGKSFRLLQNEEQPSLSQSLVDHHSTQEIEQSFSKDISDNQREN